MRDAGTKDSSTPVRNRMTRDRLFPQAAAARLLLPLGLCAQQPRQGRYLSRRAVRPGLERFPVGGGNRDHAAFEKFDLRGLDRLAPDEIAQIRMRLLRRRFEKRALVVADAHTQYGCRHGWMRFSSAACMTIAYGEPASPETAARRTSSPVRRRAPCRRSCRRRMVSCCSISDHYGTD